jgi:pimeloyl-ACP methyl ester carboxylesterase
MESFISSDGVAIAYERRGAGPRMYVCHGGPANDHRYIAVTCPVLVLYGSRDAAAVAGARTFVRHLPQVIEQRLYDIGHDPFFEDLPAASLAIESFLAAPQY